MAKLRPTKDLSPEILNLLERAGKGIYHHNMSLKDAEILINTFDDIQEKTLDEKNISEQYIHQIRRYQRLKKNIDMNLIDNIVDTKFKNGWLNWEQTKVILNNYDVGEKINQKYLSQTTDGKLAMLHLQGAIPEFFNGDFQIVDDQNGTYTAKPFVSERRYTQLMFIFNKHQFVRRELNGDLMKKSYLWAQRRHIMPAESGNDLNVKLDDAIFFIKNAKTEPLEDKVQIEMIYEGKYRQTVNGNAKIGWAWIKPNERRKYILDSYAKLNGKG